MEQFDNIEMFLSNEEDVGNIDDDLVKLIEFTLNSQFYRNVCNRIPFASKITKVINGESDYVFEYKDKKYPFSVFSDRELQTVDRKNLKNVKKRIQERIVRTLKLACSMDLIDPKVVLGKSVCGKASLLISYQEGTKEKIIDYAVNLVMDKQDYYELFKFIEFNQLDKMDLYNIYYILKKTDDFDHLYEYLLFSKEMFNDIGKKYPFLTEKYDENGFNKRNYVLLGNDCDALFFQAEDKCSAKYKKIREEVDDFTYNPDKTQKHIKYIPDKEIYQLKERNFGCFIFKLFSDFVVDDEIKQELLSDERYGKCHVNSHRIANALNEEDRKSAYIVGGKIKCNEIDYFFHSWVEIDDGEGNVVIDFNHNIVMNKENYYKLYEAVAISRTPALEMVDIVQTVNDAGFSFHPMNLNYFGQEFMRDLKKNEKILKKEKKIDD